MAENPETWKITIEDRTKHNATFMQLGPLNGQHLTGEQAKAFFLKSGLPVNVLGLVWNLADINKDGILDRKEFSIACFLIKKCLVSGQGGAVLPAQLPALLMVDPTGITPPPITAIPPMVAPSAPPMQQPMFTATFPTAPLVSPPSANIIPTSASFSSSIAPPTLAHPPAGAVFTPLAALTLANPHSYAASN